MTISYNLGFNPFWTIFDLVGRPAGGAKMYTYHSQNPTIPFPVYQDPAGDEAWTNPILFDENGQQGPFYFQFDTGNPEDLYFFEVFDAQGNLIRQIDNYSPITGGGGGSVVTTSLSLVNYLGNSVFWRNVGTVSNPTSGTILAPGNHTAMSMSDITYTRTGGGPADTLTFTKFSPAGSSPFTPPDVTPEYYLNYVSTGVTGETAKGIQYAVVSHLKTLENIQMTYTFWARGNSGTQQLSVICYQYTGTGGTPTASVSTVTNTFNLTSVWAKYTYTFTVPSSAGLTLGTNGDDALYMIMGYPLSQACNIDYTKFSMFLGSIAPMQDFATYDQIDSIVNTPRTGDLRTSVNSFAPFGWVPMNDGTIGSPTSGATTRQNFDTFFLYSLIWNQTASNPTLAPIFSQNGYTPGTRGASASIDFANNRPLSLTKALGRALSGAVPTNDTRTFTFTTTTLTLAGTSPTTNNFNTGTPIYFTVSGGTLPSPLSVGVTYYAAQLSPTTIAIAKTPEAAINSNYITLSGGTGTWSVNVQDYPVGTFFGDETQIITKDNLPQHVHVPLTGTAFINALASGANSVAGTGSATINATTGINPGTSGGPTPNNPITTYQPTSFYNVFIKL